MVKRLAEQSQSLSNARHAQEDPSQIPGLSIVFNNSTPRYCAPMALEANGTIWEGSNLPDMSTARAYCDFEAATYLQSFPTSSAVYSESGHFKRRRRSIHEEPPGIDLVPLKIGDKEQVRAFYENAFKKLQQLNCRMVAKEWIKAIEPRKQVQHPYNGRRRLAPRENCDPESTKPAWWPSGVPHIEPDHLRKASRVKLLVHIIQELLITTEELEKSFHDIERKILPPERVEIMYEVFRVRKFEKKFKKGQIDGTTVVDRKVKNESSSDNEAEDDADHVQTNPDTPNVQGSHGGSPVHTFQMPPDLHFENQIQFQPLAIATTENPETTHHEPLTRQVVYGQQWLQPPAVSLHKHSTDGQPHFFDPKTQPGHLNANFSGLPRDDELTSNSAKMFSISDGEHTDIISSSLSGPPALLVSANQPQPVGHAVLGYPPSAQPTHQIPHIPPQGIQPPGNGVPLAIDPMRASGLAAINDALRVHTDEKLYPCENREKLFSHSESRPRHYRT